ncbi:MAG: TetR family transcriptional regulator, partial [Planctomycetia bacterium]|nr:TetR family transcriptional regulator [Planctomycetia bacterium]
MTPDPDPATGEPPPAGSPGRVNFRAALRAFFREAVAALAADGVVALSAADLPAVLGQVADQVREAADAKFGDYSGTMAMALAKRSGRKPRDVAVGYHGNSQKGRMTKSSAAAKNPAGYESSLREIKPGVVAYKRARILAEASALFYEKGYESATLEMLADRLSATKPFLYTYFKGKSAILSAICEAGVKESLAA